MGLNSDFSKPLVCPILLVSFWIETGKAPAKKQIH